MPTQKVPLGKPLKRSAADLERLAQITPEDIEAAKALVQSANPALAKLLDAKMVEDDYDPTQLAKP
jgi:hypothetical protein